MLEVEALEGGYRHLPVLHGVALRVEAGEIIAVVGANGAGKSTLLKAIAGLIGRKGRILFAGKDITSLPAHRIARSGLHLVPEGRRLFPGLSVRDNLLLGAYARRGEPERFAPLEEVLDLFPRLGERLSQRAGTLSGGEQQMLAIGRGLMTAPRLLMLDEPSQGIAPRLVDEIFTVIAAIRQKGRSVLLVEQRLKEALAIADRAYVLQSGRIVMEGRAAEIAADPAIRRAYLGM